MPAPLKRALVEKRRPDPADRREMVRILCDSIHSICRRPGRTVLRQIANAITNDYPDSFQDRVGDSVIGNGGATLLNQLEFRFDNLNRGSGGAKRVLREPNHSDEECEAPSKQKQARSSDSYGCIDFQPVIPKDKAEALSNFQKDLISKSSQLNVSWNDLEQLMRETYCLQRADINGGSTTGSLQKDWPCLYFPEGLDLHFSLLVGKPLLQSMKTAYEQKATKVIRFFQDCGKSKVKPAVAELTQAKDLMKSSFPDVFGVLQVLAMHFEETLEDLVLVADVSTRYELQ
jgi:hypothetical protein